MTNIREILRLDSLGINHSQIARSTGHSRQTVVSVLKKAEQQGISYSNGRDLSDKDIGKLFTKGGAAMIGYRMPDYDHIHKELAKSGVTLSLLWVEYCEECRKCGELPYQSTQFNKYYADHVKKTGATMHIERKPGESTEVDWSGGSVPVFDKVTGEHTDAYVFVSALSYSGYAYVEAFFSMEMECWIAAHVNAYSYYGGVTRLLIPDNLRTGVDRVTRSETIINKTYHEMAEYYGTAVLPARVRAPQDKPTAEGTVGTIQTWILAALRNEKFLSLAELNVAIKRKLTEFNNRPFQKKEGSRASRYRDEKAFLLPLPRYSFEMAEWKTATVQRNYHVQCASRYYSVPYEYIGKKVDIRVSRNIIEIFYEGLRICSHQNTDGFPGKYITETAHMPTSHQKYGEWSGDRFRDWAKKIGPSAVMVIESFLSNARIEEQAFKTCNALLHLANRYSNEQLELACKRVLTFTPRPSYRAVDSVLKSGQGKPVDEDNANPTVESQKQHSYLRGTKYFGGDDDVE
jgi:transposase